MSEERILCFDHAQDPDEVPTFWLKDHCPTCLRERITVLNGEVAGLKAKTESDEVNCKRSRVEAWEGREAYRIASEKAESQVAALREALDLSQRAIETFFHHWQHGGISRDNQFHQQTAFVLREAHRKIKAIPASPSIQEPAKNDDGWDGIK